MMNEEDESVSTLVDAIQAQAITVRTLKESGAEKEALKAAVEKLLELKNSLPDGHPMKPLSKEKQKELDKKADKEKKAQKQQEQNRRKKEAKEKMKDIPIPVMQRKIVHLLETVGSGDDFHYLEKFNARLLDQGWPMDGSVYFTEKWDGTTVQATKDAGL
eukprot:GFYU01004236.1.p1 GENE.GFYU01004236.1~~GFYU01004236.1.p1  ORF type:complete len:160 (-),score=57.31 GFYU01004236.1:12-491(-)